MGTLASELAPVAAASARAVAALPDGTWTFDLAPIASAWLDPFGSEYDAYQIIQGMSGLMSVTGDCASAPLRVGAPIADTVGGFAAAFAISSALVRRSRTGEGAFLDVSMLEATLTDAAGEVRTRPRAASTSSAHPPRTTCTGRRST